jgi:hypothetical protein
MLVHERKKKTEDMAIAAITIAIPAAVASGFIFFANVKAQR